MLEISNDTGSSEGSAHIILMDDLGMCRVVAKIMLKLLSLEQREIHFDNAQDMLEPDITTGPRDQ